MSKAKILVVDDDPGLRTLMRIRLEAAGYEMTLAEGGEEALARAAEEVYGLALVDLRMEGIDGITVLEKLLLIQPDLPVIIVTAHGTIANAVEATKKGAYDYITKPFDPKDLLHRIENALEVRRLKEEVERLRTLVQERYHFDNIIASSNKMQQVLRQVTQIAATDSTVCLYGESGTGKELIARAIHVASRRAQGPFVAINCGAIPEGLLENELFGHTKGAYTGADRAQRGLLQQAEGGTVFLDEVSELPQTLQVKFLRVLQEREFYPLGAGQPVKVDIRLVAATHQDLTKLVAKGKFREDLYYRLHVIPIVLPPLRERPEDIALLASHFLQHFSRETGKDVQGFAPYALQQLMLYDWPGNVRELANVVERAVVLATDCVITVDLLLLGKKEIPNARPDLVPLREAREKFEKAYLVQVLTTVKGNVSRAAEMAGKDRAEFYRLLALGRTSPDFRKFRFLQFVIPHPQSVDETCEPAGLPVEFCPTFLEPGGII
ncbi:MAG: sigma-54-dependent Fis family transcriptional regulator [Deltaproteobacteria bacterium]|nr:sigma-54-dependent Fis family transcriptional regulator [Deltaproteobacteria bacterium]